MTRGEFSFTPEKFQINSFSSSDFSPWNQPTQCAHFGVPKWDLIYSNSLLLDLSAHSCFLRCQFNYGPITGLLNKAATDALSSSPLVCVPSISFSLITGAVKLCVRVADSQPPTHPREWHRLVTQTVWKLAVHVRSHTLVKLTTVYVLAMTVTNLISCSKYPHPCQTKERGRDLIDPWGLRPAANRA